MKKFVALKETELGGKLIAEGDVVTGEDLAKQYPDLYREATAAESIGGDAKTVTAETLERVVAELKKQVLGDIKAELAEATKTSAAPAAEAKKASKK